MNRKQIKEIIIKLEAIEEAALYFPESIRRFEFFDQCQDLRSLLKSMKTLTKSGCEEIRNQMKLVNTTFTSLRLLHIKK